MSLAHLLDPGPVHAITWALHLRRFEKIKRSPVSKVKFWFTISLVWEIVRIPNVFNIPASVIHCNHQKGQKEYCSRVKFQEEHQVPKFRPPFCRPFHTKIPKERNLIRGCPKIWYLEIQGHSGESMNMSLRYSWLWLSKHYFQIMGKPIP
jgi:hypothetical protein